MNSKNRLKLSFKYFSYSLGIFLLICLLYAGSSLVGMMITLGEKKTPRKETKHQVYIASGLIHTDFVLPTTTKFMDWNQFIPVNQVWENHHSARYISIGWGDRGFYFDMPTWDIIKPEVIFNAVFFPSETVMHVQYMDQLPKGFKLYQLSLTDQEYIQLINFIKPSFKLDQNQRPIMEGNYNYYDRDRFFKAHSSYHLFNTCNMWTVRGLEAIEAKRPFWSPFKYGLEWSQE